MRIHWHRRDLRTVDNPGLAAATADEPVVPVLVLDPTILEYASPPRMAFLREALVSLRADYQRLGGDLVVERGDPSAVLPELADELDASVVSWGADYSGLSRDRDRAVRAALEDAGRECEVHADAVLHEPGEITTNAGEHYSVYSYFWKKWREREKREPYTEPGAAAIHAVEGDSVPTLADLGFEKPEAEIPAAGTDAARDLLTSFLAEDVAHYDDRRDDPAAEATSRLSAHLKFGTIGIRELYGETAAAMATADQDAATGIEEFQEQLAWREFYLQVLDANPSMVGRNLTTFEDEIEWRRADDDFRAWCAGETGVPIVDAGMRQLREEAWMHNRLRMIVASFLTKDLLIDWRRGYEWFRERLVDHETANDAGGWQWAASTGTDAVPYFRVFNPWTQGERFDADVTYIKRYVPELSELEPENIHAWGELESEERIALAPEYPAPIVDHAAARDRAIAAFEAARGEG